jgi:hypothetical protein
MASLVKAPLVLVSTPSLRTSCRYMGSGGRVSITAESPAPADSPWGRCAPSTPSIWPLGLPTLICTSSLAYPGPGGAETYPDGVPDLSGFDLDEIATALSDQDSYEHAWLVNPETGEIVFWTADTGSTARRPLTWTT